MLKETLTELYTRDLKQLKEELSQYKDEKDIWKVKEGISNSAGTLVLHLVGNVNHFIGVGVGRNGYVRNRDAEFSTRDTKRDELISQIDTATSVVSDSLSKLSDTDLEKDCPLPVQNKTVKTGHMLVFMLAHFNYHLGQINYHRRLLA